MSAPRFHTDATVALDVAGGGPAISVQADPLCTVIVNIIETFGWRSDRTPAALRRSMTLAARWVPVPVLEGLTIAGATLGTFDGVLTRDVTAAESFDDRLEQLRALPLPTHDAQVIAVNAAVDGGVRRRWRHDTDRAMADFCAALGAYWRDVVQPHFPRLEQRVRREAERLELALEEYGHEAVLNVLHPQLEWRQGSLRLAKGHFSGPTSWRAGRLVLKPLAATPMTYLSNLGAADLSPTTDLHFGTSPPALRAGWRTDTTGTDGLGLLIGRPRAHLLRSLHRRPGTTTDLAEEFGLTPATVSHHLGVLLAAGVVQRTRRGSSVYYRVNDRGRTLATL